MARNTGPRRTRRYVNRQENPANILHFEVCPRYSFSEILPSLRRLGMSSQTFSVLGDSILDTLVDNSEHLRCGWHVVSEEAAINNGLGGQSRKSGGGTYFFLASKESRRVLNISKVGGFSERVEPLDDCEKVSSIPRR